MPITTWASGPTEQNYAAARDYLSLLLAPQRVDDALKELRRASAATWPAEAVLRAARLPALRRKRSPEVAAVLRQIDDEVALAPLLLVHDGRGRLEIADGYHRACAALLVDDSPRLPGRLALIPDMTAQAVTARFVRLPSRT